MATNKDNDKKDTQIKEKCFVIMPFSDLEGYPKGHFQKIYEQIFAPAINDADFEVERVDENKISDLILNRIFSGVQNAPIALCDLSGRNPNVLYELGLRHAYDKPVVLVQDEKTERIFDVGGINTIPYSSTRLYEDVITAKEKITEALRATRKNANSSIVKIAKAQQAVVDEGEISKEDKIEIALNSIFGELNSLKRQSNNISATREDILQDETNSSYLSLLRRAQVLKDYLESTGPAISDSEKVGEVLSDLDLMDYKLRQMRLSNQKSYQVTKLLDECYRMIKNCN